VVVYAAARRSLPPASWAGGERPPPLPAFPRPITAWTKHRYFGVDATRCIGCLRCVEACKTENGVARDAHHFRTWVERYVYLEGEKKARVDSQHDPGNIAASGSEKEYRFDNRYQDAKVDRAFFVPKLCNQCEHPPCVQVCPVGATFRTPDGVVLIDHKYCIGCQYCVQACPYGVRLFNHALGVTDKCTWCYHRITRGLRPAAWTPARSMRASSATGMIPEPDQQVHPGKPGRVLKPAMGTSPNVFTAGIDKEVV
jgi:Fe-S-cluster-containing dehydrogenase component